MEKLLRELRKLSLPKDKFAVFGSGPLAVRGMREIRDLDVIVASDLWEKLSEKFAVEDLGTYKRIVFGDIEILSKPVLNLSAEELIGNSDIIDGIHYVSLKDTLDWKKRMGREKDLEDVKLIEKFLRMDKKTS